MVLLLLIVSTWLLLESTTTAYPASFSTTEDSIIDDRNYSATSANVGPYLASSNLTLDIEEEVKARKPDQKPAGATSKRTFPAWAVAIAIIGVALVLALIGYFVHRYCLLASARRQVYEDLPVSTKARKKRKKSDVDDDAPQPTIKSSSDKSNVASTTTETASAITPKSQVKKSPKKKVGKSAKKATKASKKKTKK